MNSTRSTRSIFSLLLPVLLITSQTSLAAGKPLRKNARHARVETATKKRGGNARRGSSRRNIEAARKRAEAARLAALARQRAAEDAMRERVQQLIARDDTRGEDAEIRRIAIDALGIHAGTVVVMDPQTGRVYTMVNQQWAAREAFKPCSTIKLVTSMAGLNEEVIDPANTAAISDSNRVNLTQALAYSKNDYFQQVGGQVGLAKMVSYARQFGLGSKTGLNVQGESAGRLPSLQSRGAVNRVFSHGDGFKVTALQLAMLASAFATRGKVVVPYVPRTGSQTRIPHRQSVVADQQTWQTMTPGMVGAVRYGLGRKAYDPYATVAGKTGTCIDNGQWVGLFTSYAPLNNPRFAIAVIAKGSDGRNHFPAAVAGRIYRQLNTRLSESDRVQLAGTAQTADIDAENEEEAGEEEETNSNAASAAAKPILLNQRRENGKVQPILMTVPSAQTSAPAARRQRRVSNQR